jgi:hypothetical protein
MHWKKGTSRVVLVIPALGICLKFARIRLWTALRGTFHWPRVRARSVAYLALRFWRYSMNDPGGGKGLVLRGIRDNLREGLFSIRRSHSVLARTYVTLGFVNVQEAVGPCLIEYDEHFRRLARIVGYELIFCSGDVHAFEGKNFGVRGGKAVVLDYASLAIQNVLIDRADQIHDELDLASPS